MFVEVEWLKQGTILTNDDHITVLDLEEISPGNTYRSTITFQPLTIGDTGDYTCRATIRPVNDSELVVNGIGMGNDTLTVIGKLGFIG